MILLFNQFAHLFYQFRLRTIRIAIMLIDDIPLTVDDEYVWNHLDSQGTFEVAVGIQQDVIFPAVVLHQRLHLIDILCLVYADSDDFHTRLFLPVLIDFSYGIVAKKSMMNGLPSFAKVAVLTDLPSLVFNVTEGNCAWMAPIETKHANRLIRNSFFIINHPKWKIVTILLQR